ncbi:MAG: hypothetical protein LBM38_06165 [Clostridiales bacterium]|jgi:hypothetical protein|nr:hypothetical protein [Clostridiales bacterium]
MGLFSKKADDAQTKTKKIDNHVVGILSEAQGFEKFITEFANKIDQNEAENSLDFRSETSEDRFNLNGNNEFNLTILFQRFPTKTGGEEAIPYQINYDDKEVSLHYDYNIEKQNLGFYFYGKETGNMFDFNVDNQLNYDGKVDKSLTGVDKELKIFEGIHNQLTREIKRVKDFLPKRCKNIMKVKRKTDAPLPKLKSDEAIPKFKNDRIKL